MAVWSRPIWVEYFAALMVIIFEYWGSLRKKKSGKSVRRTERKRNEERDKGKDKNK